VIVRLVAAAAGLAVAAVGLDRWLAEGKGDPAPIRTFVVIDASPERVWAELADIEGQPRWMREMKRVRLLTAPPVGAGTRGEATVRIFGIAVTDPVTVTEFDPPRRFGIRHEGTFGGRGVIELEPGADRTSTIVRWEETLIPPLLPHLGAALQRPILERIFQDDLGRFRELLEAASAPAGAPSSRTASAEGPSVAPLPPSA
jgi:uncharacterized protein YndB with AHSA1/START domain